MKLKWKSYAEWAEHVYTNAYGKHISEDTHYSPREAESVCRLLERDGFGGARQEFPIKTWTDKVED